MLEPLTLTASSIRAAQRLARQLTVNQVAVAVLNDKRDTLPLRAAQPAPHRPQRGKAHESILVGDWVKVQHLLAEVNVRGVEARVSGDFETAARLERRAATLERLSDSLKCDLEDVTAPRVHVGHRTRYVVDVPAVRYVHPEFGLHAESPAVAGVVDFDALTDEQWAVFAAFRRDFPAKGAWPLYKPCAYNGLLPVRRYDTADEVRALLLDFLNACPQVLPAVQVVEVEVPA